MFPASQTWVLIPNVWYSAPRIQNVRIYWISGLIWIITIGLWRLWWQNIKRAKWKYSHGEQYSAAQIVEQSFRILNRFMKLISFDTCSNEIVSNSIGRGEYQWANVTGIRRYANKKVIISRRGGVLFSLFLGWVCGETSFFRARLTLPSTTLLFIYRSFLFLATFFMLIISHYFSFKAFRTRWRNAGGYEGKIFKLQWTFCHVWRMPQCTLLLTRIPELVLCSSYSKIDLLALSLANFARLFLKRGKREFVSLNSNRF